MKKIPLKDFYRDHGAVSSQFSTNYLMTEGIKNLPLKLPERTVLTERINKIRSEMFIEDEIIESIITAITSGKHLLLYGPPGTGKTTLAEKVSTLFDTESSLVTATADWSTYDTIGGLKVTSNKNHEQLVPTNGCLTTSILKCCQFISNNHYDSSHPQAHWLIIDELNRANMDTSFGQVFTALDSAHPQVNMDFHHDELKRLLFIPRRFKIIGTINTFDKNFLHRLSYGLMRRFAYIPILPPNPMDNDANQKEQEYIWGAVYKELNLHVAGLSNIKTIDELKERYSSMMDILYKIIFLIRGTGKGRLERGLGTAQVQDCFKHLVFNNEIKILPGTTKTNSLDTALTTHIIPQLEGIRASQMENFITSFSEIPDSSQLKKTTEALNILKKSGLQLSL